LDNYQGALLLLFSTHGTVDKGEIFIELSSGDSYPMTSILKNVRRKHKGALIIVLDTCLKGEVDKNLYVNFKNTYFICAKKNDNTGQTERGSFFTMEFLRQLQTESGKPFHVGEILKAARLVVDSWVWMVPV